LHFAKIIKKKNLETDKKNQFEKKAKYKKIQVKKQQTENNNKI
jgi:hypothetical protein